MTKTTIGDHAVVLGASMAGLLAARVLTDAYARVTVVERDILPFDVAHRRGVPQGLHLHDRRIKGLTWSQAYRPLNGSRARTRSATRFGG
jgi:hypothetical protein